MLQKIILLFVCWSTLFTHVNGQDFSDSTICISLYDRIQNQYYAESLPKMGDGLDSLKEYAINGDSICQAKYKLGLQWYSYRAQQLQDLPSMWRSLSDLSSFLPFMNKTPKEYFYDSLDVEFRKGNYHLKTGNLNQAESIFSQMVVHLKDSINVDSTYDTFYNVSFQKLGDILIASGQFHRARDYFEYTIYNERINAQLKNETPDTITNLTRLGKIYKELNDFDRAHVAFEKVNQFYINVFDTMSSEGINVNSYYAIPSYLEHAELLSKAYRHEESAHYLEAAKQIVDPLAPILIHIKILEAKNLIFGNELDEVEKYLSWIQNALKNKPNIEYAYQHLLVQKEYLEKTQQSNTLIDHIQNFILEYKDDLLINGNTSININVSAMHIEALKKENNLDGALAAIKRTESDLLQRLSQLNSMVDQDLINRSISTIIEVGLNIIYENYPEKVQRAFELIELRKAAKLLTDSRMNNFYLSQATDSLQEIYTSLKSEIHILEIDLLNRKETDSIRNVLFEKRFTLKKIMDKIQNGNSQKTNKTTLFDLQENLTSTTSYINYFQGDKKTFALYVDQASAKLYRYVTADIHQWVIDVNSSLKKKEIKYLDTPAPFFDCDKIGGEELIISADGKISEVPFDLIWCKDHYLIEHKSISYTPSAQWLLTQNNKPTREATSALLMAPTFETEQGLTNLHFSQKEIDAVEVFFDQSKVFQGPLGTKQNFIKNASDVDCIHLSTHAFAVNEYPALSHIVFNASKRAKSSVLNDRLYFNEISNMNLNAEMVVLSACNTGTGKLATGEGMLSMARNFLLSGCQSVVSTLWTVNDQTTSELFRYYYEGLKSGLVKSKAMQHAKKEYLANKKGEYRHPYYWAGLKVTGSNAAIFKPKNNNWKYVFLSLGIIFVLLLLLRLSKKYS